MKQIGRNDPCPCGSGKKYKKCCEQKDQQAALEKQIANLVGQNLLLDSALAESPDEFDDQHDLSHLPATDRSAIDQWWKRHERLHDADDIRAHLEDFFQSHPHLVEHLGLENDTIFELGGDYLRHGRPGEFISFLINFRERFAAAYKKGATYYDGYIINWLVSQGRNAEVKNYLNYLADSPDRVDEIYWVLNILLARDLSEEALFLAGKTNTLQEQALNLILFNFLPADINGLNEKKIDDLVSSVAIKSGLGFNPTYTKFWSDKLHAMIRAYSPWVDQPPKKDDLVEILFPILSHFARHLHDKLKISWYSAQYYADNVIDYLQLYHEARKKPASRLFHFPSVDAIKKQLYSYAEDRVGFIDTTTFMATLNGLYYFAGYLEKCGNFTAKEADAMRNNCIEIYEEVYPELETWDYEALCFGRFPVWGEGL